jgi:hypothetical protein
MTSITKWLVLGVTTPAKSDTCIFSDEVPAWAYDSNPPSDMQWAVRPRLDPGFLRLRLLRPIIEPLEVKCAGWTGHHHGGDVVR